MDNTYTVGNSLKKWFAGYFTNIYLGDPSVQVTATAAELNELVGGGNTNLHLHDDRYLLLNSSNSPLTSGLSIEGSSDETQFEIDAHTTQISEFIRFNGNSQNTQISYIAGADAKTATFYIGETDTSKGLIQYDGTPNIFILGTNDNGSVFKHLVLKRSGELVVNEDGLAALDFRVEGNTISNLFKVDAGNDQVEIHGGELHNVTTVNSSTYTLLLSDYILHVIYTTTGACTITLPTAQVVSDRTIVVKDAGGNANTNNITIDTQGSETIDGASTAVISNDYGFLKLYSNGTDWFIIS